MNEQATAQFALPADRDSFTFYKLAYAVHWYYPLWYGFLFSAQGHFAYANTFNGDGLPFYENYFAGGIGTQGQVRGYDSYTLGPRDSIGNPLGGNALASASLSIILPYPLSQDSFRSEVFIDGGNVYARGIPALFSGTGSGPIRFTAGIGAEWHSPFGPLQISVGVPLRKQPGDRTTTTPQFTISSGF